jgi:hypothetical protein
MKHINTPYTCQKDLITKDNPFINQFPNRRERRQKETREFNNSNSYPLIVKKIGKMSFVKYVKTIQLLPSVKKNLGARVISSKRNRKGNQKMKPIIHYTEC